MLKLLPLSLTFFLLVLNSGCGLLARKGGWGKKAFWPLRGERAAWALKKNASSAHVWGPLAGAGLVHLAGVDRKIGRWAVKETPVYHDGENAAEWSDTLNNASKNVALTATVLTPSYDEEGSVGGWAWSKAKGTGVVMVSSMSARYSRDRLAHSFPRLRPNGLNRGSFPSSHTTKAATWATLTRHQLDAMGVPDGWRIGVQAAASTMAFGTAWARLEAQKHYPSDVLVGWAVGSFVSGFLYDFLMNEDMSGPAVSAAPVEGGWSGQLAWSF